MEMADRGAERERLLEQPSNQGAKVLAHGHGAEGPEGMFAREWRAVQVGKSGRARLVYRGPSGRRMFVITRTQAVGLG